MSIVLDTYAINAESFVAFEDRLVPRPLII